MLKLSYKSKQYLFGFLKVTILISLGYVLYNKLDGTNALSWTILLERLTTLQISIYSTLIILCLTIGNWFFEIKKWQCLVAQLCKISFAEASKHVLASQTTTLFTPMRAGEYGIKVLYFKTTESAKVLKLNFIGNMAQLLVTVIFGCIGGIIICYTFHLYWGIRLLISFIIVCIILLSIFKQKGNQLQILQVLKASFFKRVLGFSIVRYVLFSTQFYSLLLIFEVSLSFHLTIASIFLVYIISSFVPILSMFDALLKGSVAVYIFSWFNIEPILILCVTTIMWILNALFPSVLGIIFLLKSKFTDKLKPQHITQNA